jgi:hypothetical protein
LPASRASREEQKEEQGRCYREKGLKYLEDFFNDQGIDGYYRYKTIISKSTILGEDIKNLLSVFLDNYENPIVFKVLASQYILTQITSQSLINQAQTYLLSVMEDHTKDYNIRADAMDILLQYGDDNCKEIARIVLQDLAGSGTTIYNNAQNVHTKSIEDSVNKILCELNNRVDGKSTFEICLTEFTEYLAGSEKYKDSKPLKMSLQRISVDKAIYGNVSMTLMGIFTKLWSYIKNHQHREELIIRLCEELEESNELCSTGYISRMLNCLSGITDLSLTISYEDQIISNMGAKLNSRIMEIDDEKYRDAILEEMMLPSYMYSKRYNFLRFFRHNISSIREDLYQEFVNLIEDIDFDLYTRRAIMKYQGDLSV